MSVSSDVELPPEILIPCDRLKLLETIGQGEYGYTCKALFTSTIQYYQENLVLYTKAN